MMINVIVDKLDVCQREIEEAYAEIAQAHAEFDKAQKRRLQRLNLALSQWATLASLARDAIKNK